MPTDREILRTMTFGAYDLQQLRMQTGLRLCANFRAKLRPEGQKDLKLDEDDAEAKKILDELRASYRTLTEGVARNRTLPSEKGFKGDQIIGSYAELILVSQYMDLEKQERQTFSRLESGLDKIPIYTAWLKEQPGIGPAMAAVLISYFNPHSAPYVSSFWSYAGLDVGADGFGRSRRENHLIDREYKKKDGTMATKKSVTYNPWLKARLLGAMGPSFMRVQDTTWRQHYDNYKNRLLSDPNRKKVTLEEFKKMDKETRWQEVWSPLRIHQASIRYMVKMFLQQFWREWRTIEGLPLTPTYQEAKLGHQHGEAA